MLVLSHSVVLNLCDPVDCSPPASSVHGDSPGKNTGVGGYALLQGISPTQGSNPYLLHCRWILYRLSYQGSPVGMIKHLKSNSQIDYYHLCSCSTLIFAVFAFYHSSCKEAQLCNETSSKGKQCHIMLKPWTTSSSSSTDGMHPCFPQKIKIQNKKL